MIQKVNSGDVICLCGSTRFLDEFKKIKFSCEASGAIVFTPEVYHHYHNLELTTYQVEVLNELHKLKIGLSDYIIIINVDGYIGESTQDEIEYAKELNIPIYYLEEVDNG